MDIYSHIDNNHPDSPYYEPRKNFYYDEDGYVVYEDKEDEIEEESITLASDKL